MKKFKFIINGSSYEVSVNGTSKDIAEIEVNGTPFTVQIEQPDKDSPLVIKAPGKVDPIRVPQRTSFASAIKAPLPGSISKILVTEGQSVKRGDILLTMESMKMENNIVADEDGIIKSIRVQTGQTVMQDDVLIDFEGFEVEEELQTIVEEPKVTKRTVVEKPKPSTPVSKGTINSPLPGTILKVAVSKGQSVKKGDILISLESMKMENNILADNDGVVKKIYVQTGQSVMQDDKLMDLE